MLLRWRTYSAILPSGGSVRLHGAPVRSKRAMIPQARCQTKSSKERFSLTDAMLKDRERIERNKTLPWKERLAQMKVYPWKTFVVFMILWSYTGTYVVPWLKGLKPGQLPAVGPHGQRLPPEAVAHLQPTPAFDHLVRRKEDNQSNNRNAPRF